VWHEKVMKKTDVRKEALLQASNGAIIAAVAGNSKALGYVGYGYLNSSVKPIMVNGVVGTLDNGKSGKFPVSRKLYMYVNKDKISAETDSFLKFLLSEKGQALVAETGFIPL
jgi:phosphate transport system substrate-binding protein